MKVKINGVLEEIEETSVFDLLKQRNIEPGMVAVELNSEIVEKEGLSSIKLREGDELEFLYFMGGGYSLPTPAYRQAGAGEAGTGVRIYGIYRRADKKIQ